MNNETKHILTSWPKGTVGYAKEMKAIDIIEQIGEELGYGRLSQLAEQMMEMKHDSGFLKKIEKNREKSFKSINWKDAE